MSFSYVKIVKQRLLYQNQILSCKIVDNLKIIQYSNDNNKYISPRIDTVGKKRNEYARRIEVCWCFNLKDVFFEERKCNNRIDLPV